MTKPQVRADQIELTMVQMMRGGLETSEKFQKKIIPPDSIDFEIGYLVFFNPRDKKIGIRLELKLTGLKKNKKTHSPLGINAYYIYHFYFNVGNFNEFIINESIDPSIVITLLSISYSTLRGIILERTAGTLLGNVVLPIINPVKFLNDHKLPETENT